MFLPALKIVIYWCLLWRIAFSCLFHSGGKILLKKTAGQLTKHVKVYKNILNCQTKRKLVASNID